MQYSKASYGTVQYSLVQRSAHFAQYSIAFVQHSTAYVDIKERAIPAGRKVIPRNPCFKPRRCGGGILRVPFVMSQCPPGVLIVWGDFSNDAVNCGTLQP